MKIIIKTIKGEAFPVEVQNETTIGELKQKIFEQKGLEVETQKLIVKGKNTADDQTIQQCGMQEGSFMVVMTQKKPVNQGSQQEGQQQQAPVLQQQAQMPIQQGAHQQQQQQQSQQSQLQQQQQEAQQYYQQFQQSDLAVSEQNINELMAMGFPREDCVKALKAAFNNVDRAVDYLLNGIPQQYQNQPLPQQQQQQNLPMPGLGENYQPQQQQQGQQQQQQPNFQQNSLAFLAQNPQFQQIKQAIRQNPQLIQVLLPQIAASNPQLYQLINQNPEQFMQLLQDDAGMPNFLPQNVIQVTQQEKEAIDRLVDLGFPKQIAIEAYFACDKNEEMAANYLFDLQMKGEFQEEGLQGGQQGQQQQQQQEEQKNKEQKEQKEKDKDEDNAFS